MKNILDDDAEILVNTVNCVGVMGAGVALDFKNRFPKMFVKYKADCMKGLYVPGAVYFEPFDDGPKRLICNFTTKNHWKFNSQYEWIITGLYQLRNFLKYSDKKSIAIPPLGCGLGGLDWTIVKQLIQDNLVGLDKDVRIYEKR